MLSARNRARVFKASAMMFFGLTVGAYSLCEAVESGAEQLPGPVEARYLHEPAESIPIEAQARIITFALIGSMSVASSLVIASRLESSQADIRKVQ